PTRRSSDLSCRKKPSGGLLHLPGLFDHAHHVTFLHDEQVLAVELDLRAGPFAEQDMVADLHVERDQLAGLVAGARTDGDDFALLRLFLGSVRDDDAPCRLLLGVDTADQNPVMEWTEVHVVLLIKDKQSALRAASGAEHATLLASRARGFGCAIFGFQEPPEKILALSMAECQNRR